MIETFAVTLENPKALLSGGHFVARLEEAVAKKIPACKYLLRWAIVSATDQSCMIEGAYRS